MGEGACNISATSLVADFAAQFSCELLNSFQLLDCIFRKKAFLYLFDVGWNGASQFVQFACSVRQFRCVLTFDVRPCIRSVLRSDSRLRRFGPVVVALSVGEKGENEEKSEKRPTDS